MGYRNSKEVCSRLAAELSYPFYLLALFLRRVHVRASTADQPRALCRTRELENAVSRHGESSRRPSPHQHRAHSHRRTIITNCSGRGWSLLRLGRSTLSGVLFIHALVPRGPWTALLKIRAGLLLVTRASKDKVRGARSTFGFLFSFQIECARPTQRQAAARAREKNTHLLQVDKAHDVAFASRTRNAQ